MQSLLFPIIAVGVACASLRAQSAATEFELACEVSADGTTISATLVDPDGAGHTVSLAPTTIRTPGCRALYSRGVADYSYLELPKSRLFEGTSESLSGARVYAALSGERMEAAVVSPAGQMLWCVEPIDRNQPGALHRADYVLPSHWQERCATLGTQQLLQGAVSSLTTQNRTLELAIDLSAGFVDNFGPVGAMFEDRIPEALASAELAVLLAAIPIRDSFRYEIRTRVAGVVVRDPTAGLYEDACIPPGPGCDPWLVDMESVWDSASVPAGFPAFDVAHAFVSAASTVMGCPPLPNPNPMNLTRPIGKARIGSACAASFSACSGGVTDASISWSNGPVSFELGLRTAVVAHEIGHNLDAEHCDGAVACRIMCTNLGGCDSLDPFEFSSFNDMAVESCGLSLAAVAPTQQLPPPGTVLFDPFDTLDFADWPRRVNASSENGGTVTSGAVFTSPPASVKIIGGEDSVLEREAVDIDNPSFASPHVAFTYRDVDVEAGERLVVEIFGPTPPTAVPAIPGLGMTLGLPDTLITFDWQPVFEIESDGIGSSAFTQFWHPVPPSFQSDEFRLRFRTISDPDPGGTDDDDVWLIDDFVLSGSPPTLDQQPQPQSISPSSIGLGETQAFSLRGDQFLPGSTVAIGGQPATDVVVFSSQLITGMVPPATATDTVDVVVTRGAEVGTLVDGFTYTTDSITHEPVGILPANAVGGVISATARIYGDHTLELGAYSFGVRTDGIYGPGQLTVASVTDLVSLHSAGELVLVSGGAPPPTVTIQTFPEGWTYAVIGSLIPGLVTIPPTTTQETLLAEVTYSVPNLPQIPPAGEFVVPVISESLNSGAVPLLVRFVDPIAGVEVKPSTGTPTISTPLPNPFIRGDCDNNGTFALQDVIIQLQVLFSGVTPDCELACDFNGDGQYSLPDAIGLLAFLFSSGSPPAQPYPDCAPPPFVPASFALTCDDYDLLNCQ